MASLEPDLDFVEHAALAGQTVTEFNEASLKQRKRMERWKELLKWRDLAWSTTIEARLENTVRRGRGTQGGEIISVVRGASRGEAGSSVQRAYAAAEVIGGAPACLQYSLTLWVA